MDMVTSQNQLIMLEIAEVEEDSEAKEILEVITEVIPEEEVIAEEEDLTGLTLLATIAVAKDILPANAHHRHSRRTKLIRQRRLEANREVVSLMKETGEIGQRKWKWHLLLQ